MSLVIAIIAVLTAGALTMGSSVVGSAQLASTQSKLDVIEQSLMAYRLANNRLPCPSDPALTDVPANATTYGYENGPAGNCTVTGGESTYTYPTGSTNTNYAAAGMTVVEGALPVKTLGLPDEFQYDGWGRKLAYAVTVSMTGVNAFVNYGAQANCGAINVENSQHSFRTQVADYVLLSYGSSGHGGYVKSGTRLNANSDNADVQANCHCTNTAVGTTYAATYIQQDPTQATANDPLSVFDDIVRYKERWQMQNAYDANHPQSLLPCTNGFLIQASAYQFELGNSIAVGDINGDGIPDLVLATNSSATVIFGTRAGFPDPLPVTNLNGANGFIITGSKYGAGFVAVGDINGDGYDDIVFGNNSMDYYDTDSRIEVFYGGPGPWPATVAVNGTNGFSLMLPYENNFVIFNSALAMAVGDFNGDGYADIAIGSPTAGAIYADGEIQCPQYGTQPITDGDYFNIDGTHWTFKNTCDTTPCYLSLQTQIMPQTVPNTGCRSTIQSMANDLTACLAYNSGLGCDPSGHISQAQTYRSIGNGNILYIRAKAVGAAAGLAFPIGFSAALPSGWGTTGPTLANGSGSNATLNLGSTYVLFGGHDVNGIHTMHDGSTAWSNPTYITSTPSLTNGTNGVEFDGTVAGMQTGSALTMGDVNGDGIADLIIGAPYATVGGTANAGVVYVVFGKYPKWTSSPQALTTGPSKFLNGVRGFELDAHYGYANSRAGGSLAVGDVNGDGIGDIIIGGLNAGYTSLQQISVVYGRSSPWGSIAYSLSSTGLLNGTNGFSLINGNSNVNSYYGQQVAAGDVNGDGYADILITAYGNTYEVIFGKSVWPASTSVTAAWLNGLNGVDFTMTDNFNYSSSAGAAVGDINGDGLGDVIFGDPLAGASWQGAAYIYFGRASGWPTSAYSLNGL